MQDQRHSVALFWTICAWLALRSGIIAYEATIINQLSTEGEGHGSENDLFVTTVAARLRHLCQTRQ